MFITFSSNRDIHSIMLPNMLASEGCNADKAA